MMANQVKKFNELYIGPKGRKLLIQQTMDKVWGRAVLEERAPTELRYRLEKRAPRKLDQTTDQDWTSVWPAAQSFKSSVVPIPVRMGYRKDWRKTPARAAYGNLELIKIPNFLHLSPKHIQRHCEAIKKFCTKFPEELKGESKEKTDFRLHYFPVEVVYSDYVHQGTNIRDIRAREVTLHAKLNRLELDTHAHNKFLQLVGQRYNPDTDWVTLTSDRCPTRNQNREFCTYLLTALYHESNKVESWEETFIQELLAKKEAERQEREHSDLESTGRLITDGDAYYAPEKN